MIIVSEKSGILSILNVQGRIDAVTSPDLEKELSHLVGDHENQVLIDLAGVDYISSAGLRVFFAYMQKLQTAGGLLAFSALTDRIEDLFYTVGFLSLVSIFPSKTEAIARLSR